MGLDLRFALASPGLNSVASFAGSLCGLCRQNFQLNRGSRMIWIRRFDESQKNVCAVSQFNSIAFRFAQYSQKLIANRWQMELRHQIDCARGVFENLNRLDSGNVIEKPSAACVHQKQHALKLQIHERAPTFFGRHPASRMVKQKLLARSSRVEDQ